jgi:olfactory receptor
MAYDRYVAICRPLHYASIITEQFVVKSVVFILIRNMFLSSPNPILSAQLHFCGQNIIENYVCANLSVSKLSCDSVDLNRIFQLTMAWTLLGSDLILIFLSYTFILRAVLRLKAKEAVVKALSTCGSHFILILFFSTILLVLVFTHVAKNKVSPDIPILLNVLHHVIPAALNPIVYGVRTQEIKQGILKLLKTCG